MAEIPQRIKPEPRRPPLIDTLFLRIELDGIRPVIWRTVMVPVNITLRRLHDVIQAAMGWDDCHLHTFKVRGREYGDRTVFLDDLGPTPMKEERSVTLQSLGLAPLDTFAYEYDMGDSWEHTITVVGTDRVERDMEFQIIDGDNACPPEDVGGVHGYAWFVHSMMDPQHEDHEQVMEWYGRRFDHTMYDLRGARRLLSVIVLSGAGYPWRKA
ncbi:MAG: plasmid pRiA4b ORF-3 family protein [Ignavibacteriae bacterium]|nr:MAG: plasmid pRiA4b ORF-3 family protein [Ignavibacteriota bacterium]